MAEKVKYPHLIILYGRFGNRLHEKQQAMIDGRSVCGYRDYARKFGEMAYLCPQNTSERWDWFINGPESLFEYLKTKPDSIIWSVKHDPTGEKDRILARLPNKRVFYSCCSYNTINDVCDISLVDTKDRVRGNAVVWVKGKDPDFWKPQGSKKVFDYCMVGKRGDKNEVWFIDQLTNKIKDKRNIMWVGGLKHASKIKKTHHNVVCTEFAGPEAVRSYIDLCKVGVLLSEIPAEGFPQSFLEMTMMGLPVVYMGPINKFYMNCNNSIITNKQHALEAAEIILNNMRVYLNCRQSAINNYSLEKSYESILRGLNVRH